jgi:peptidoglycan/xylan/chitin deacetylase (PgdA/CDA1 family)
VLVLRLATFVGSAALCLVLATVGVVEARPGGASHREAARAVTAAAVAARPATAHPTDRRPTHRSPTRPATDRCRGLVALTFDDGPRAGTTRRLVGILRARDVPATFFMVGSRVIAAPRLARLVARNGFTVANHTWDHGRLTSMTDAAVRRELRRTVRALRAAGVRPSDLARPPYGAVTARVRADFRQLGLRPVLWTIDSRDWAGGTPAQIAARVLSALRPHRANIVLQHDGVTNSPNSVSAVPAIIRGARHRGYCFAALDARGKPVRPAATPPAGRAQR